MDICVILKWLIKYLYFIDYNLNKENKQKMTTHIKHPESLEMLTLSRVKANIYEGLVSARTTFWHCHDEKPNLCSFQNNFK